MVAIDVATVEAVLSSAVAAGTIYLTAALGEVFAERSGVLNLGIEGMMIVGAALSYIFTLLYGHAAALLIAALAGALMALLLAVMTVTLRLNQVVVGLAVTLFGIGLSGFIASPEVREPLMRYLNPSLPTEMILLQQAPKLPEIAIPFLSQIPIVGRALFNQNIIVYLSLISAFILWFILFKTSWGLVIRSVGENPAMADSLGVNVYRTRYYTTIVAGAFASLAGAYLLVGYQPFWVEGMTAGKGFIALALVILATWNPLRAVLGAYLFGGVETFQFRVQLMGLGAQAPQFVLMLPYVITIIALIGVSMEGARKRLGAPSSLGIPYTREE